MWEDHLKVPWTVPLKKPQWRMCQLINFVVSNEETESKIRIYAKNWARKFWILVKGQRKKSTSTSLGQSQRIHGPGRVMNWATEPLVSPYDVSQTWTRTCVFDDVIRWCHMTSAGVLRRVEGTWRHVPTRGGETETQVACVMSYKDQILWRSRSGDDKAVIGAHVAEIRA